MEHSDESTSSTETSAITTPSSSDPCILINIVPDLLESIFLRVPSQQYPQIRRTCRALKGSLDESMFLGRYIEEQVVERGEIMVPVKLGWRSRVARYRNRCSGRVSWELDCKLGSCYYRCYNIRNFKSRENRCYNTKKFKSTENGAESSTLVSCHDRLFCPWIECSTWHRWFDVGFVRTFLRNRAPEFENNTELENDTELESNGKRPRCGTGDQLCNVCSGEQEFCSCMSSLLCIKNPITGVCKMLRFMDGKWTSKLKCIARSGPDHFKVLVAMLDDTNRHYDRENGISFVKTMIYDSVTNSWIEFISQHHLQNMRVVDTHGVYCRDAMYWLLEANQSLIVFSLNNQSWAVLKVTKPQCDHPLGLVVCKDQVLMAGTKDKVIVIWKLIRQIRQREWQIISRSTEEIFDELQRAEMAMHSAHSPNGDDIVCFENLLNRTSVVFNVNTRSWGRSNDIHCI